MKILSILPLTDSYSRSKAGAVSLFINEIDKKTKDHKVVGSTLEKDFIDKKKYINFKNISKLPKGKNNSYVEKILPYIKKNKFDLIEIHNRPQICNLILKEIPDAKIILYFHNNPNTIRSSISKSDKLQLLSKCKKIIFISEWIKDQFFKDINCKNSDKTEVVYHAPAFTKKRKKEKIITFAGKLNSSKGYDIFCKVAELFLNKYQDWKFIVAGDEPREKIYFSHKNFINKGWMPHSEVSKIISSSLIVIVPSQWEEPLGRVAIEASKSGSILITSNKGGLLEGSPYSFFANSSDEIYSLLEKITQNKNLQNKIIKKNSSHVFSRTSKKYVLNKISNIRKNLLNLKLNINLNKPIKILHVADLHLRHNGRLFYSSVKKLNNGFVKNNYNLQSFSDRDVQSFNKKISDINGAKYLNKSLIDFFDNFKPDMLLFGHADNVSNDTLEYIKKYYKGVAVSQWFLDPIIKTGPDYKKNLKRIKSKIMFCDSTFVTTDPKAISLKKKNIYYLPNPVDETIDCYNAYENTDPIFDLFIAISHGQHRGNLKPGKIDDRVMEIKDILNSNYLKTNFFGFQKQPVWGDEFYNELLKCSMGINLSRGKPINLYSSDRIASLMGNGLLTLTNEKYGFKKFFTNREIVTYKNNKDLVEKAIYFKENPKERNQIAKNGKLKYFKLFNNTNITKYIVCKTLGIKFNKFWQD